MIIVAHRGWTREHPENTLAALLAARDAGCRHVEFDVRRTADGGWVVHHDADLQRMCGLPHVIAEHDTRTLCEATRSTPAPLTQLDDALGALGPDGCPLVEVKEPDLAGIASLVEILTRHGSRQELVAIGRGRQMPSALRERLPSRIPVFHYTRNWPEVKDLPFADGFDLPANPAKGAPPWPEVEAIQEILRERGQKLAVWTVNEAKDVERWRRAGAHYLITATPWSFS